MEKRHLFEVQHRRFAMEEEKVSHRRASEGLSLSGGAGVVVVGSPKV